MDKEVYKKLYELIDNEYSKDELTGDATAFDTYCNGLFDAVHLVSEPEVELSLRLYAFNMLRRFYIKEV